MKELDNPWRLYWLARGLILSTFLVHTSFQRRKTSFVRCITSPPGGEHDEDHKIAKIKEMGSVIEALKSVRSKAASHAVEDDQSKNSVYRKVTTRMVFDESLSIEETKTSVEVGNDDDTAAAAAAAAAALFSIAAASKGISSGDGLSSHAASTAAIAGLMDKGGKKFPVHVFVYVVLGAWIAWLMFGKKSLTPGLSFVKPYIFTVGSQGGETDLCG